MVAIIGCGVIGSALAHHFAKTSSVTLCDRTFAKSLALAKEIGAQAVEKPEAAASFHHHSFFADITLNPG